MKCCLAILACFFCVAPARGQTTNDLLFIHHSSGGLWLSRGLHDALLAKPYVDERNDCYYGTDVLPRAGRPDSLGPVPGDLTDMNHWVRWFNDYFPAIRNLDCTNGYNRIVMFKSCFPNSHVSADGTEPGDPFSGVRTRANYRAVFRHPNGPGNTYDYGGYTYLALEDIFSAHPDMLFIPVTSPPLHFSPADATDDAAAHRARLHNNWLKDTWLPAYITRTGLHNVAVFDWFDVLAYPDDHADHPNRLRAEYGGDSGDSHPNNDALYDSVDLFATDLDNFIDAAWATFSAGAEGEGEGEGEGTPQADLDLDGLPDAWERTHGLDDTIGTGMDGAGGDPDHDGLKNAEEYALKTHPRMIDTDNDNLPDGWEQHYGLNPRTGEGDDGALGDPDCDGYTNGEEYFWGTNPTDVTGIPRLPLGILAPVVALGGMLILANRRLRPRKD